MATDKSMWRVVVPYHFNDGTKIPRKHHLAWDDKVCDLTNGLMLRGTVIGKWGRKKEKVIQVDVACNENTIHLIRSITKEHYQQEDVCVYCIGTPAFVG